MFGSVSLCLFACFLGGLFAIIQYQVLLSRESQVVDATMEARFADSLIVMELESIFRAAVRAQL